MYDDIFYARKEKPYTVQFEERSFDQLSCGSAVLLNFSIYILNEPETKAQVLQGFLASSWFLQY